MAAHDPADVLRRHGLEPDPVIEHYKRRVDRTRLRENLRRTLAERMELLLELQRMHEEARRAPGTPVHAGQSHTGCGDELHAGDVGG